MRLTGHAEATVCVLAVVLVVVLSLIAPGLWPVWLLGGVVIVGYGAIGPDRTA